MTLGDGPKNSRIRVKLIFDQAQVQAWDPTYRHEPTEEEWRIIDDNGVCCLWYPPRDRVDRTTNEKMISDQEIQKFELEAETYGFKPEQALGKILNLFYGPRMDELQDDWVANMAVRDMSRVPQISKWPIYVPFLKWAILALNTTLSQIDR